MIWARCYTLVKKIQIQNFGSDRENQNRRILESSWQEDKEGKEKSQIQNPIFSIIGHKFVLNTVIVLLLNSQVAVIPENVLGRQTV